MLIIIEGPDGGGKTTLASALTDEAERRHLEVMHLNYGQPAKGKNAFEEYEVDFLKKLPDDPSTVVICDRLAAGELVYGPLLRNHTRLTEAGLLHCEMLYASLGAVKLMMMPPDYILINRLRKRGDDIIEPDDIPYIRSRYAWIAPRYGYRQLRDTLDKEQLENLFRGQLRNAYQASEMQKIAPGYTGSLTASTFLAGDVRSGFPDADDPYIHAFTPAAHGSAEFLMNALEPFARSVVQRIALLNTGEPGMKLQELHRHAGAPRWVALGNAAARRLKDAGIEYEQLEHPSHARRFGGIDGNEKYGRQLAECCLR